MTFEPSPQQQAYLETLVSALAENVAPHSLAWERAASLPPAALRALGDAGAFGIPIPRERGGRGLDFVTLVLAVEAVSKELPALGSHLTARAAFTLSLSHGGSEEQKRTLLEPVASGQAAGTVALSEEDWGGDLARLTTRARRDGTGYILEGEKTRVMGAGSADFFLVVAVTDPERGERDLTAFVLPAGSPDVRLGPGVDAVGLRSADLRNVRLEAVRLEAEHRVGPENGAATVVRQVLETGRIGVGAQAVGIARGACDRAIAAARASRSSAASREGASLAQDLLAQMVTEIDAARWTVLWAAQLRDAEDASASRAAVRAELAAIEMCGRVTSMAMEMVGERGALADTGIERFHRDAKAVELLASGRGPLQRQLAEALLGD